MEMRAQIKTALLFFFVASQASNGLPGAERTKNRALLNGKNGTWLELADRRELLANNRQFLVESLFGQVAKTVVYGGATFVRFNSRLLCPLLSRETELENEDQPTLFVFNNRLNQEHAFRIYSDDDITASLIGEAQLDASQMTVILVHGWLGGIHNELWLSEAKRIALNSARGNEREQQQQVEEEEEEQLSQRAAHSNRSFRPNVIVVEWSEFAHGSLFAATQNSFKVSRRLARMLAALARVGGLQPELMHCLGHSIGAHICGQAARLAFGEQRAVRLGRITGLDPGGFCYELGIRNETTYLGLRPSDALLVDAYYSNRTPFGNRYLVGQYNVRLGNAYLQRPCSVWRNPRLASDYFRAAVRFLLGNVGHNDLLTCDHYFATRFAHQLPGKDCSYVAYACSSYRHFTRGLCGLCNSTGQCYTMDFEYQRTSGSISNAIEHINNHSSYFNHFGPDSSAPSEGSWRPPGGVAYASRRLYYMQIANEQPYCSMTFRVRVYLDGESVDLSNFRSDLLRLSFLGSDGASLLVRDSHRAKMGHTIEVHGPWWLEAASVGLDNRTLTGMFELPQGGPIQRIERVRVGYADESSWRQQKPANPVHSIQVDYLSSADESVRLKHSRLFAANEIELLYEHMETSAAPEANLSSCPLAGGQQQEPNGKNRTGAQPSASC